MSFPMRENLWFSGREEWRPGSCRHVAPEQNGGISVTHVTRPPRGGVAACMADGTNTALQGILEEYFNR
jgi:hypothetical protein